MSDIGFITLMLARKQWGQVRVGNQLKSEKWWRKRLKTLIEDPTIINIELGVEPLIDIVVPFEQEYPEVALHLIQIVNHNHQKIKSVAFYKDDVKLKLYE